MLGEPGPLDALSRPIRFGRRVLGQMCEVLPGRLVFGTSDRAVLITPHQWAYIRGCYDEFTILQELEVQGATGILIP